MTNTKRCSIFLHPVKILLEQCNYITGEYTCSRYEEGECPECAARNHLEKVLNLQINPQKSFTL